MCLNFFIIKIGCDNDNTVKIDTSVLLEVTNTVVQDSINRFSNTVVGVNELVVNNSGVFNCPGGFNISQTNYENVQTINKVNTVQSAEINTQMTNKVEDKITQEQTKGILAFLNSIGQAGSVNNSQDITNKVKEAVKNAVTQSIIDEAWTGDYADNKLTLNNSGVVEGGACNIVQNNALDIRVTNLATTVQKTLASDAFINDLINYSLQTQTSAVFPWKWLILAGVILAALIIIGVLLYFIFGSKGSTPAPGASKTQQQIKEGLERRLLEKKEGGIGSSSKLKEFERLAENRVK